jgi:hypothetical protein
MSIIPFRGNARSRNGKSRKYPIFGQVTDVDGDVWDVRDARGTKHGFELYFGSPANDHGAYSGGLPRLIATRALWEFWDANRVKSHGFLFDLPAGRTTLKRVRRRFGFNFDQDWEEFWEDRLEDLALLTPRKFAAKHGVTVENAFDRRTKMLGTRARPIGWWRKPEIVAVLLSGLYLREMGEKLDISSSQAFRLRRQAQETVAAGVSVDMVLDGTREQSEMLRSDVPLAQPVAEIRQS